MYLAKCYSFACKDIELTSIYCVPKILLSSLPFGTGCVIVILGSLAPRTLGRLTYGIAHPYHKSRARAGFDYEASGQASLRLSGGRRVLARRKFFSV